MKKIMHLAAAVVASLGLAVAVGCGASKSASPESLLAGKTFDVASIQGNTLSKSDFPDKKPFISFGNDGTARGNTGCNNFNGKFNVANGKLSVDPGAMTRMACPGAGEQMFLKAIQGVDAVKMVKKKIVLLQGANEVMQLIPRP